MEYSHAIVKDVRSGFCLVLLPTSKDKKLKDQPEKTILLSWVLALTLGEGNDFEKDMPFAWGSREFMRKLCIGKHVEFCVHGMSTEGEYGAVKLGGVDVAGLAISEGWAKLMKYDLDDLEGNPRVLYQELLGFQNKAMEEGRGLWNKGRDAAYESSRDPRPRALRRQILRGMVVQIVSGDHIIVVVDGTNQERQVFLSSITCPKLGVCEKQLEPYADEAKEFVRAYLIGRQVRVIWEYSIRKVGIRDTKTYDYGTVFLGTTIARNSRDVSQLVISEGLGIVSEDNDIKVVSNCYDALCRLQSDAILNKKGIYSGVKPPAIQDFSNVRWEKASDACNHIFYCPDGKYKKLSAVVESVIRTKRRDKIILVIRQEKKYWKIAFSLYGVTWPRGNEPYADEAINLLRQTIVQRTVEVELMNIDHIDEDGYFVGALLESNTHVAIPLLQAGLAKLEEDYPKAYNTQFNNAQKYAREEKLKIWENYV